KNVYSRVNSKATTQWRKTESANGVHLEGVASDNRKIGRASCRERVQNGAEELHVNRQRQIRNFDEEKRAAVGRLERRGEVAVGIFFFKQKTAYEFGLGIPAGTALPICKNVYSRVNSKATTQWRKTESANGVHLEGVASDNR